MKSGQNCIFSDVFYFGKTRRRTKMTAYFSHEAKYTDWGGRLGSVGNPCDPYAVSDLPPNGGKRKEEIIDFGVFHFSLDVQPKNDVAVLI